MIRIKTQPWVSRTYAALAIGMIALLAGCAPKGNAETEFWVRGNCEMCQETIEEALAATPGVAEAKYDLDAHMAHVRYDSAAVTPEALHKAVSNAGYETKLVPASPTAYQALPKCCKKEEDM